MKTPPRTFKAFFPASDGQDASLIVEKVSLADARERGRSELVIARADTGESFRVFITDSRNPNFLEILT